MPANGVIIRAKSVSTKKKSCHENLSLNFMLMRYELILCGIRFEERAQRVGIASHAVKFLNNVDLCKKVTETNSVSDEGEVASTKKHRRLLPLMISL